MLERADDHGVLQAKSTNFQGLVFIPKMEKLLLWHLSNDPGKNCTIFYCSDAISFPHIEKVVFLGQEFLN